MLRRAFSSSSGGSGSGTILSTLGSWIDSSSAALGRNTSSLSSSTRRVVRDTILSSFPSAIRTSRALGQAVSVDLLESSPSQWSRALTALGDPLQKNDVFTQSGVDPYEEVGQELELMNRNIGSLLEIEHPVMRMASSYYFQLRGKRMRPLMVLLIGKAARHHAGFAYSVTEGQLRLAEITEMIHVASLAHDDVIDQAETRRGAPSLNSVHGNKISILAGDFLLGRASLALARLRNTEVIELLSKVIEHLALGEVMQMTGALPLEELQKETDQESPSSKIDVLSGESHHEKNKICEDLSWRINAYMHKSYLKTASLLANSCHASALLSIPTEESPSEELRTSAAIAHAFGRHMGLAYQLIDDTLDFVSDSKTLGKPVMADLRDGLVTAPVLFAARYAPSLLPLIERQFSKSGDIEEGERLVGDHYSRGCDDTRRLAYWHAEQAVKELQKLAPSRARDALISLSFKIAQREA